MSNVQVCVPWRPGDAGRAEGWAYNRRFWERHGYRVSVADSDPERPFNRAQARNRAAAGSWTVAIFADACILPARERMIRQAVELAQHTGELVHGHTEVARLTEAATQFVLQGGAPASASVLRRNGPRTPGGILIVPRRLFDAVGGWDEGFEGWGAEDGAFVARCTRGRERRNIQGPAYHLWHVHSDRDLASDAYARNRARAAAAWAGQ